jgi:AcrR family transcriptional regulator
MKLEPSAIRSYQMGVRAELTAETGRKIIQAATELWRVKSLDDLTLQEVADRAGVTVQTVIRRFGSKEGLIEAAIASGETGVRNEEDDVPAGDIEQVLEYILAHYERDGDAVLRTLAIEDKLAAAMRLAEHGRLVHRTWCARVFTPYLPPADDDAYPARLDAFVAATDLYLWKLIRRDLGRTAEQTRQVISALLYALPDHNPEYLPGPGRSAAGPGFLPRADLIGRLRDGLFTQVLYRTLAGYLPAFNEARQAFGLAPLGTAQELLGEYHRADLRLIQTLEAFDFPITPRPANVRYVGPVLDDPGWTEPWSNGGAQPRLAGRRDQH